MAFSRKHVDITLRLRPKAGKCKGEIYLEVALSDDGNMECELERIIGAAMRVAGEDEESGVLEQRAEQKLEDGGVQWYDRIPTLMYVPESWVLKENKKQRI